MDTTKDIVSCPECDKDMIMGSLAAKEIVKNYKKHSKELRK
jgi:hypothetical protein